MSDNTKIYSVDLGLAKWRSAVLPLQLVAMEMEECTLRCVYALGVYQDMTTYVNITISIQVINIWKTGNEWRVFLKRDPKMVSGWFCLSSLQMWCAMEEMTYSMADLEMKENDYKLKSIKLKWNKQNHAMAKKYKWNENCKTILMKPGFIFCKLN